MTECCQTETKCCQIETDSKLKHLIRVGVVIGAGCIPCTKLLVEKAIENGCAKEEIELICSVASALQNVETFRKSVGEEVIERMKRPLEITKEILESQ
ncbi:MAG: carboxymuconolactone decarboxylase family protein [Nitrospirota bacterium]